MAVPQCAYDLEPRMERPLHNRTCCNDNNTNNHDSSNNSNNNSNNTKGCITYSLYQEGMYNIFVIP